MNDEFTFFQVCQLIGKFYNITLSYSPDWQDQIRFRSVHLPTHWWQRNYGALIGFNAAKTTPFAFIPDHRGHYVALTPTQQLTIDKHTASEFSDEALMLYVGFPKKQLVWQDLLLWGDVRRILYLACLYAITMIAMGIPLVYILSTVTGSLILADDSQSVGISTRTLLLLMVLIAILHTEAIRFVFTLEVRLFARLHSGLWDYFFSLPLSFYYEHSSEARADLATVLEEIRKPFQYAVQGILTASLILPTAIIVLFTQRWPIALYVAALLCFRLVAECYFFKQAAYHRMSAHESSLNARLLAKQMIIGISTLRNQNAAPAVLKQWQTYYRRINQQRIAMKPWSRHLIHYGFQAGIFFAALVATQQIKSVSAVIVFWVFCMLILGATEQISRASSDLAEIYPSLRVLKSALKTPVQHKRDIPGQKVQGTLEVSNITFRYRPEHQPVLSNLTLTIQAGEHVAIIGESGSGKSTLLRMLIGLETPESGSLVYSGVSITSGNNIATYGHMGYVMQDSSLSTGSIKDNLLGNKNLSLDDAWKAARIAAVDSVIRAMPMQMMTILIEGMNIFSRGQQQRLLLARALAHCPNLLILDDAMSALDNATRQTIAANLKSIAITQLHIVYRRSELLSADRILVMHRGEIVQEGTYEELNARSGLFHRIIANWGHQDP
jgi:ABC-type bacteriocin/lantibiotic exporter with double-glycine peptidase domain